MSKWYGRKCVRKSNHSIFTTKLKNASFLNSLWFIKGLRKDLFEKSVVFDKTSRPQIQRKMVVNEVEWFQKLFFLESMNPQLSNALWIEWFGQKLAEIEDFEFGIFLKISKIDIDHFHFLCKIQRKWKWSISIFEIFKNIQNSKSSISASFCPNHSIQSALESWRSILSKKIMFETTRPHPLPFSFVFEDDWFHTFSE